MFEPVMSLAVLVTAPLFGALGEKKKVRRAAVAGGFYPADAAALSKTIDEMLNNAAPIVDGEVIAAVAPHAGYEYSGPVAAYTYAALKAKKYARVVIIAPSHYAAFDFSSVYDGDAYATPLGEVPVDKEFASRLAETPGIRLSEKGHAAIADGGEHAIEVQLPWLQKVLGEFSIVPVVMGDQSYESSRALSVALWKLVEGEDSKTLVLASSDLSHYHGYNAAQTLDHKTLVALQGWDYLSMSRNFASGVWEACGGGPILAAMIYAERAGANRGEVLQYRNSGDTSGDHSRVVGYSADIFLKAGTIGEQKEEFRLSTEEENELLRLARKSVEFMVKNHHLYEPPQPADSVLNREAGAFVTLMRNGHLRGCVGYTSAVKALYMTIRDTAALAAMRDTRFSPVTEEELPELSYEVSVLSPLRRVTNVEEIAIGRDGLLVKDREHEGLLLPQVAMEHHWDRTRFLEETCSKAGMDREHWRSEEVDIFRFSADVFKEAGIAHSGEKPHSEPAAD